MGSRFIAISLGLVLAAAGALGIAVYRLASPNRSSVGDIPSDLPGYPVQIAGARGTRLRGWYVPSPAAPGAVVLMHGVHANRLQMVARARFLRHAGYSVLLYDSRGHGESGGDAITFGSLESEDAKAVVSIVRDLQPNRRIGVIGVSLGGASALLANPPLPVQALVVESVYPTIEDAIADRLKIRLGPASSLAAPLLIAMIRPRLGFSPAKLRPIDAVRQLRTPKFFIFGTADRNTTPAESLDMFQNSAQPKQMWAIEGAGHVDLHRFAGKDYEDRILDFLRAQLCVTSASDR
jgi:fermentation-respiration switch protein FrsA (DUF1100 family)